jgi:hypothetical protein
LLAVNSRVSMTTSCKYNKRSQSCFAKNLYAIRTYCRQFACHLGECLSDQRQERARNSCIDDIHTLYAVKLCQLCHKQKNTLPCLNTPQAITVVMGWTELKVNVTCLVVLCVHTRCQNKFHLCNCKAAWSWCISARSEVFLAHKTSPGLFVLQVCWSTEQAFCTHFVEWEPLNWNYIRALSFSNTL